MLAFFLFSQFIYGQTQHLCVKIKNKKAIDLFKKGLNITNSDYKQGYMLLRKAIEIEPDFVDAYYVLGEINYDKALKAMTNIHEIRMMERYYSRAENNFLKVTKLCPSFNNYQAYYFLGEFYYDAKRYRECGDMLMYYLKNGNQNSKKYTNAIKIYQEIDQIIDISENPVPFNPVVVEGVSSKDDEFLPYFSPDGEFVFYTRRYLKKNHNTYAAKIVEEFTYSQLISRSDSAGVIYSSGDKMPLPFNDGRNQGGVSISIDNNHLYITICEHIQINNNPYKNCDIFVSHYQNGKWSELENLGDNINGKNTWEGQPSISADGEILYFASARENGCGGIDIYKSILDTNTNWSPAINLGSKINTAGDDKSPFMHSDNSTLYFSTNGRKGLGRFDIYYAKIRNGNWTDPINIGYPINTSGDDLGFIVSTDGSKAYFSSNKFQGVGGYDIYAFDLYEKARPKKVLFVKGKLIDETGKILVDAKVQLKSVVTSKTTEGIVDRMTGKYALAVSVLKNEDFILTIKKKNYSFASEYIDDEDEYFKKPGEINFEMKPIEVGTKVKLNNIYFSFNSDTLDQRSKVVLDNFTLFLMDNPNLKIKIEGHTDDIDTKDFNMDLSIRRAKVVRDFLWNAGIDYSRIEYKGYGETVPVTDNESERGRALNRRTEFVILQK